MLICRAHERDVIGTAAVDCRCVRAWRGDVCGDRSTLWTRQSYGGAPGQALARNCEPRGRVRARWPVSEDQRRRAPGTTRFRARRPRGLERGRAEGCLVRLERCRAEPIVDGARAAQDRLIAKKKSFVASEQDRPDVAEERARFRKAILELSSGR